MVWSFATKSVENGKKPLNSAVSAIDARENPSVNSDRLTDLGRTPTEPNKLKKPTFLPPTFICRRGFPLNKNDLVAAVAEKTDLSKADATKAVDGVFDAITDALKGGDEVRLVGFGTFNVATRAATTGRNPRTGETINIPASKQPKFKAGKGLKDAVN